MERKLAKMRVKKPKSVYCIRSKETRFFVLREFEKFLGESDPKRLKKNTIRRERFCGRKQAWKAGCNRKKIPANSAGSGRKGKNCAKQIRSRN